MDDVTLKEKLMHCHKEELEDVEAYTSMALEAHKMGHYEICGVLKDISEDERTHAEILHHVLDTLN